MAPVVHVMVVVGCLCLSCSAVDRGTPLKGRGWACVRAGECVPTTARRSCGAASTKPAPRLVWCALQVPASGVDWRQVASKQTTGQSAGRQPGLFSSMGANMGMGVDAHVPDDEWAGAGPPWTRCEWVPHWQVGRAPGASWQLPPQALLAPHAAPGRDPAPAPTPPPLARHRPPLYAAGARRARPRALAPGTSETVSLKAEGLSSSGWTRRSSRCPRDGASGAAHRAEPQSPEQSPGTNCPEPAQVLSSGLLGSAMTQNPEDFLSPDPPPPRKQTCPGCPSGEFPRHPATRPPPPAAAPRVMRESRGG